ncbi:MAG: hypothetical protein Q7J38_05510 [Gallionella sp.]|nr:hypothetical protein [Gallionella sp.]
MKGASQRTLRGDAGLPKASGSGQHAAGKAAFGKFVVPKPPKLAVV